MENGYGQKTTKKVKNFRDLLISHIESCCLPELRVMWTRHMSEFFCIVGEE